MLRNRAEELMPKLALYLNWPSAHEQAHANLPDAFFSFRPVHNRGCLGALPAQHRMLLFLPIKALALGRF